MMSSDDQSMMTALVAQAAGVADQARGVLAPVADMKAELRDRLVSNGQIVRIDTSVQAPRPERMCAVDGGRVTENLYSADLIAAVACIGESKSAKRRGEPVNRAWAGLYPHSRDVDRIAGAAMAGLELQVATAVQHEVVLLDGSFLTPVVEARKGLASSVASVRNEVARIMEDTDFVTNLRTILDPQTARLVLALPKSETSTVWRDDINEMFGTSFTVTDRVLAAQVLEPGEMMKPRPLSEWSGQEVLVRDDAAKGVRREAAGLLDVINSTKTLVETGRFVTTYVRPPRSVGVIRIEFHTPQADDMKTAQYVASLILGEMSAPHTMEPFAQWAADRQAKKVSQGAQALKLAVQNELAPQERSRWGALFHSNYRTN